MYTIYGRIKYTNMCIYIFRPAVFTSIKLCVHLKLIIVTKNESPIVVLGGSIYIYIEYI